MLRFSGTCSSRGWVLCETTHKYGIARAASFRSIAPTSSTAFTVPGAVFLDDVEFESHPSHDSDGGVSESGEDLAVEAVPESEAALPMREV